MNNHGTHPLRSVGYVSEIWRYPVSSLAGEICSSVAVDRSGIAADRCFGLFDPETGDVASPETQPRWRPALFLQSRITNNDEVVIRFPDDREYDLKDGALLAALHQHFGFRVAVGRYPSSHNPDYDDLPLIANRYQVSPLHVLTSASMAKLGKLCGSTLDPRRFRPSVLISVSDMDGFVENDWTNCTLHIGGVHAVVIEGTKRCGMTFIAQTGLDEEPEILRNTLRHNQRKLGVYCDIAEAGRIDAGAEVFLATGASA